MYCHGFGDCHLLALATEGEPFYIVIDCGVVYGTPDEKSRMRAVAKSILDDTGGRIDVLVVTHEHYDHLSGFNHAADIWSTFAIDQVWLAWTEDKTDALALEIDKYRDKALPIAQRLVGRLHATDATRRACTYLEFLPAYSKFSGMGISAVKNLVAPENIKTLLPGEVISVAGSYEAIVLGPPHNRKRLKDLVGLSGETFGHLDAVAEAFGIDSSSPGTIPDDGSGRDPVASKRAVREQPFDPAFEFGPEDPRLLSGSPRFDDPSVKAIAELRELYDHPADAWRRIDDVNSNTLERLALQLDSLTNNLSLALAFAIDDQTTFLYPGDAQIGNWKSWGKIDVPDPKNPQGLCEEDLTFWVRGKPTTVKELLRSVKLYKAGHHASHNGTWRQALDQMPARDLLTFIPQEPVTVWPGIPQPDLVNELRRRGSVVISDRASRSDRGFVWSEENVPGLDRPLWVQAEF